MEKRIAEIILRCKAINAEQADIESEADLKNAGQFTDDQRKLYAGLNDEFALLLAEKNKLEDDAEMKASRAGRAVELQPRAIARKTPASSGAPAPEAALPGIPIQVAPETEDLNAGLQVRVKIPRTVLRVGNPRSFRGVINNVGPEERAYRFGMWCLARLSRDIPGRFSFPDAQNFVRNYMHATNTVHGETGGTTGGEFLVPDEFSADIIILRETYGVSRRLFQRSVMTSDVKHEPKRATGLTAYFTAEGAAGTESNMTWSDIQLVAKDLMVLSRISNQLSMDAVISVGDTIAGEMAYAFANKEDDCAFNGNGKSTYGGINGVLNLLTDCDGSGTDSKGLTVGTGSGWSGLVLADFNKCAGTLPVYATTPNTCWVTHKAFYHSTMQRLEMAAGGNTLMSLSQGDASKNRPLFMGWPVEFAQVFPSSTAAGVMCAFGDFGLGALFGDRQQTSIAFSEHAVIGGQSVFENNQIAIRATERFDINVHGCGDASNYGPIVGLSCG